MFGGPLEFGHSRAGDAVRNRRGRRQTERLAVRGRQESCSFPIELRVHRGVDIATMLPARARFARGRRRMPPRGVKAGNKRERPDEQLRGSERRRGLSNERSDEIAVRAGSEDRSEAGERARKGGGSRKKSSAAR